MSPKGRLKNLIRFYETEKEITVRENNDNESPLSVTPLGFVSSLTAKINCETLNNVSGIDLRCNQRSRTSNRIKSYKLLTIRTDSFINKDVRNDNVTQQDVLNNSKVSGLSQEEKNEEPAIQYIKVPVKQAVLNFEHLFTLSNKNVVKKTSNHNSIQVPENSEYKNHEKPKIQTNEQKSAFSEELHNSLEDIQKTHETKLDDLLNQNAKDLDQKQITSTSAKHDYTHGLVVLTLRKGETAKKKRKPLVVRQESDIDLDFTIIETVEMVNEMRYCKTTKQTDDNEVEQQSLIRKYQIETKRSTFEMKEDREMIKEVRDFQITTTEQPCDAIPHTQLHDVTLVVPKGELPNEKENQIIKISKNFGEILNSLPPPISESQNESMIGFVNSAQLTFNTEKNAQDIGQISELFSTINNIKKNQKMRVDELIETEKAYVNQLRRVVRHYIPCLQDQGFSRALLSLDPEDIFCNLKQIYKFHARTLLPALIDAREDMEAFGNVFIKNEKKKHFGHEFDLMTHLTYPLQRLTRLPLFIESMLKNYTKLVQISKNLDEALVNSKTFNYNYASQEWNQTTKHEKDLKSLDTALDTLSDTIKTINLNLTLKSIIGLPTNFKPTGKLKRQATFNVVNNFGSLGKMKCFLFENCILLTDIHPVTTASDEYFYRDSIPMEDLFFTPSTEDIEPSFSVRNYGNTTKQYFLKGESPSDQKTWERDINQFLWRQMLKLREEKKSLNFEEAINNNDLIRTENRRAMQKLLLVNKGRNRIGRQSNNSETSGREVYNFSDTPRSISCDSQISVFLRETELQTCERLVKSSVEEILESEEEYVQNLALLLDNTIEEDPDFYLIPEHIFRNTEEIYSFHSKQLLPALKRASNNLTALGEVFIENERGFHLYNTFSNKKESRFDVVNQHKFLCREIQIKLGQDNMLTTFFLNPFRRISSYFLTLGELTKNFRHLCDHNIKESNIEENYFGDAESLEKLLSAKHVMEKLLQSIDENMYMETILHSQVDMMEQGELLRSDRFFVTDDNETQFEMRCFLFEKSLMLTVIHLQEFGEYFHYHDAITLSGLGFTPPRDKSFTQFTVWYQKFNSKRYTLRANLETLTAWIKDINQILWTQMISEKEKRRSDFAKNTI